MAERKMTPKGFLSKVLRDKSAEGFLKQYREYMLTGELYPVTTPILDRLDSGELLPTPAINELTKVVFEHIQALETQKALDSIANKESEGGSTAGASKPVQAIIFDAQGNETERKGCDKGQEGMRWVDRHLFDAAPGSYGQVIHTSVLIKGEPMCDEITREDAFARILGTRTVGPVLKRRPTSVSRLGGQMKVCQSRAHFSHG